MKTDVLLSILYFGSLIRQVNFQCKIAVFDPLSCSCHACFCIFMIIFGDAATSNIFQISLDDLDRIFLVDEAFIP